MAERIADKERALKDELKPRNELESIAITEIARASIQHVHCEDQVIANAARAIEDVDLTWDDDQRAHIKRVAGRLGKAPERVADAMEQSRHGAEHCLRLWVGLGQAVAASGRLTDEQRALAFDLMGIPLILRGGTHQVPAADDAAGLSAVIEREIQRLEDRIETVLNDRDQREQDRARRGLPRVEDNRTRQLRSNAARAYKRFVLAMESFQRLRADLHPRPVPTPPPPRSTAAAPSTSPPPTSPPPAATAAATAGTVPWWLEQPANRAAAAQEKQQRRAERIRRNAPQSNTDAAREAATAAPETSAIWRFAGGRFRSRPRVEARRWSARSFSLHVRAAPPTALRLPNHGVTRPGANLPGETPVRHARIFPILPPAGVPRALQAPCRACGANPEIGGIAPTRPDAGARFRERTAGGNEPALLRPRQSLPP
jgi:hypothetical protein